VLDAYQKRTALGGASAPQAQTLLSQPEAEELPLTERTPMPTGQAPILEKRLARGLPGTSKASRQAGPAHPDVICRLKPPSAPRHQTRMAEERVSADCLASGECSASYSEYAMSVIVAGPSGCARWAQAGGNGASLRDAELVLTPIGPTAVRPGWW